MSAPGDIGIFLNRCPSIVDAAVKIRVLRHMSRRKFPFAFAWQAVGIDAALFCQPATVGLGILIGDEVDGIAVFPGWVDAIRPV